MQIAVQCLVVNQMKVMVLLTRLVHQKMQFRRQGADHGKRK